MIPFELPITVHQLSSACLTVCLSVTAWAGRTRGLQSSTVLLGRNCKYGITLQCRANAKGKLRCSTGMVIASKKLLLMATKAATKLEGNNWQRNEGIHQVVHLQLLVGFALQSISIFFFNHVLGCKNTRFLIFFFLCNAYGRDKQGE